MPISSSQFVVALREIGKPKARQLRFLRAHYRSRGRISTARKLAEAAGYENYGGVNLHYGLLAARVGRELGKRDAHLVLLVEFIEPRSISNKEWLMMMRPAFAKALKLTGWV